MLENLYTTKMSSSKRVLQNRFSKIRRKSGHLAKTMSLVITIVLIFTISAATVALAAAQNSSPEIFDKNEIYFIKSMSFNVNVAGKNVPSWVNEDVAGEDGNIFVTINRYQIRYAKRGTVTNHTVLVLEGENGTTRIGSTHGGDVNKADDGFAFPYSGSLRFIDTIEEGGWAEYVKPFTDMGIMDKDSGKRKYVEITFGVDEENKIRGIFMDFALLGQENAAFDRAQNKFDVIEAPVSSMSFIASGEKDFLTNTWDTFFTDFEINNYNNIKTDEVNISIEKASPEEIIVNTDVNIENAKRIEITAVDVKSGETAAVGREEFADRYVLTKEFYFLDGEKEFIKGNDYRVSIGVLDGENNLLYRWQSIVTIE